MWLVLYPPSWWLGGPSTKNSSRPESLVKFGQSKFGMKCAKVNTKHHVAPTMRGYLAEHLSPRGRAKNVGLIRSMGPLSTEAETIAAIASLPSCARSRNNPRRGHCHLRTRRHANASRTAETATAIMNDTAPLAETCIVRTENKTSLDLSATVLSLRINVATGVIRGWV